MCHPELKAPPSPTAEGAGRLPAVKGAGGLGPSNRRQPNQPVRLESRSPRGSPFPLREGGRGVRSDAAPFTASTVAILRRHDLPSRHFALRFTSLTPPSAPPAGCNQGAPPA